MTSEWGKFTDLLSAIVDNRGKTCPVGDSGLPLIATNCINADDLYPRYETKRFVSDETYRTWFRGHPKPGDILFICKGSPGRTNWVPDPVDFCIAQDMVAVRANPAKVYPKYLFATLRSEVVQSQIDNMHVGTMIPHFKKGDFDKLRIPLLDSVAQVGVGDFYFDLAERINLLRETNATLEAIAQALFKSWFVDFDPVRAKMEGRAPEGMDEATAALFPDSLEETALGSAPKGWTFKPVAEVVQGVYDGPHATPPEAESGGVFLGIKNLTGTALDLTEIRHIGEDDWAKWTKRVEPRIGDIVFSYEATLGFFALVPPDLRCCLGRRLALIRPNTRDGAGHFWFHQFVAEPFQRLLDKHTIHGATVNRIALKEFPSYSVLTPPVALQMAFDQVAAAIWSRIHANQAQAQVLAQCRDTLLPRLISGQVRLPEAVQSQEEYAL
ncbi:restriction endonuclease subunit S [Ideonella azotifigens]|uniref:Restriction endonuclease subunit S n=1 Tax=Ideonella azotifigens TaxID=513160 RepID=A0ABN1K6A6_9BURK|nr:restriction endonuclease subunit S [Ideonella azotifigens]MCD2342531.1 restriction endonuclease subunit S [Ideonella azotifigens]